MSPTKTIMLIDDELPVVTALKKHLERNGFTVLAAESSTAGLDIVREDPARIDLLITDFTMPDLDGIALASKIHSLVPDLPILLMSGYGSSIPEGDLASAGIRGVVSKPFRLKELSATISSLLDA